MATDGAASTPHSANSRLRAWSRTVAVYAAIILASLTVFEFALRVIDVDDLRLYPETDRLPHDYDAELGWYPIPNKVTEDFRINSLGLRDIEPSPTDKPTILFIGDSFVWGWEVDDDDRFTDLMRQELPGFRIVNAGVVGYGTDQEFLLLQRLWAKIEPAVVVLIVCVTNDHYNNSINVEKLHSLKPYLVNVDGRWAFQGQPVPRSPGWYYYNNWFANHLALARLAIAVYKQLRHPVVRVPDPTNQLVGMMRDFVEARGARFVVGLEYGDAALEPFLAEQKIPYTRFDGAEVLPNDYHWSAQGHALVAERLKAHFAAPGAATAR